MASLVTTSRMQQCFYVPIDSYHEILLLFYCCVLLEIKLTTTTNINWIIWSILYMKLCLGWLSHDIVCLCYLSMVVGFPRC